MNEVEEGVNVLKTLPEVREVAEMEATEPRVFADVNSNEPEETLPGKVSTTLKTPLGVVVKIPTRRLLISVDPEARPKIVRTGSESR